MGTKLKGTEIVKNSFLILLVLIVGIRSAQAIPIGNGVEFFPEFVGIGNINPTSRLTVNGSTLIQNGALSLQALREEPVSPANSATIFVDSNNKLFFKSSIHTAPFRLDIDQTASSVLVAPDGSPNPAVAVDNNGLLKIFNGAQMFQSTRVPRGSVTILHGTDAPIGVPSHDSFRLRQDSFFFGGTQDAVIFEKTDADSLVDGGFAFVNTGSSGVPSLAMSIRGSGKVGIGIAQPTKELDVLGQVQSTRGFVGNGRELINLDATALRGNLTNANISATRISSGALPNGVTLPATQISSGALPSGVTLPATQISSGALPSGVTINASQITGSINATVDNGGVVGLSPDAIVFADSTGNKITNDATKVSLLSSTGNVGIGLANPTEKLEVAGKIKSSTGFIGDGSQVTNISAANIVGNLSPAAKTNSLYVLDGRVNPELTLSADGMVNVYNGLRMYNKPFRVLRGTTPILYGTDNPSGAPSHNSFRIAQDTSYFTGANPGDAVIFEKTSNQSTVKGGFVFVNTASSGVPSLAMTIRGTGNVGIGVVDPTEKLEVAGKIKSSTGFIGDGSQITNVAAANISGNLTNANIPATRITAGALPSGITLPATQITAGNLPSGVNLPGSQITGNIPAASVSGNLTAANIAATRITAGALPSGVTLPATQLTSGSLPAGITLPATQLTGIVDNGIVGGLSANAIVFADSTGNKITNDTTKISLSGSNVGVGIASPAAKLDVTGEVKIGNTSLACSSTTAGALRYNSSSKIIEFCDGVSWKNMLSNAQAPGQWFGVTGGSTNCATFCSGLNPSRSNVQDADGARCVSAEVKSVTAVASGIAIPAYGSLPRTGLNTAPDTANPVFCYNNPQVKDYDTTDLTVGCFCR